MTRHNIDVTLRHMLDYSRDAVEIAESETCESIASDNKSRYALLHLICIIGEAANRLPQDFRAQHGSMPWNAIIGMRNRLIHGYDIVDTNILWDTITLDLPKVVDELTTILDQTSAQDAS